MNVAGMMQAAAVHIPFENKSFRARKIIARRAQLLLAMR
jgi:hypothetical protein